MVHSSAGSRPAHAGLDLLDLILLRLAVFQHEVHLQQLGDEIEGQRLAVLVATAGQERDGALGQPALELVGQAGLADARRARPPRARCPARAGVLSKASRRKASARWRPTKAVSPRSSARSKRARPLSCRVAVKVRHGRRQPLERHLAGGLDDEVAAHQAHRGFADPRAAGRRHLLQARREVHRLALGRVVHAQVVADLADDDRPGVDPDAHGEVDAALCAQRGRVLPHRLLMARAAATARTAWSSWAMGAPKSAMMPSPVNWLTVPSKRWIASSRCWKQPSITPCRSSGSRRAESSVKPAQSTKTTVTCLRSPSMALREVRIRSARCLGV